MAQAEDINPRMLSWAREAAGLTVAEAAKKLGLKDTRGASAVEKLLELEQGKRPPTTARLLKAAQIYRRPLVLFYLAEPPPRGDRGEDFRATKTPISARDNAALDDLVRDIRVRQQMLREMLEDQDEAIPRPFVGSARIEHGATKVAASIREALGITEDSQQAARDPSGLFALLRAAVERIGVFVLLLGDVGSHHSDVGENVFRGFAIADEVAPFVVINDNDAEAARSFTLLHELAHIWIGATGVSGPLRDVSESVVERLCNDAASEFLLPPDLFPNLSNLRHAEANEIVVAASRVAEQWNVSQAAVVYRIARSRWIPMDLATAAFAQLSDRWRRERQRKKDERDRDEGGPTYHVLRRSRLGQALISAVRRGMRAEVLSTTRAAKILGVSPSSVGALIQEPRPRAA